MYVYVYIYMFVFLDVCNSTVCVYIYIYTLCIIICTYAHTHMQTLYCYTCSSFVLFSFLFVDCRVLAWPAMALKVLQLWHSGAAGWISRIGHGWVPKTCEEYMDWSETSGSISDPYSFHVWAVCHLTIFQPVSKKSFLDVTVAVPCYHVSTHFRFPASVRETDCSVRLPKMPDGLASRASESGNRQQRLG